MCACQIQAAAELTMAADAAIVTLALSRSGAETGTHNRTNATNDQLNRTNANGRTNKRNGRNCKLIASRKGGGEIRGGAVNPLRTPPNNSSPPRLFAFFALRYLSCLRYRFGRYFAYERAFVPNSEIFRNDQAIVSLVAAVHFANNVVSVYIAFYEAV